MQTPRTRKHVMILELARPGGASAEAWLTWGLFAAAAALVLARAALV